jgi:hypothetical protein
MKTLHTLEVPTEIRDAETGKLIEQKTTDFMIMPAPAGTCPECAHDHPPELPHNQQRLHYQYTFYAQHGRWPTWADAIAHCSADMQTIWKEELIARGAWSEPEPAP